MSMGAEPVYQPTTVSVSYEPRPGRKHGSRVHKLLKTRGFQNTLLVISLIGAPLGMIAAVYGIFSIKDDYSRIIQNEKLDTGEGTLCQYWPWPILYIVCGLLLIISSILALGLYFTLSGRWIYFMKSFPYFVYKKPRGGQLQCQHGVGRGGEGIIAWGPSTDPLVTHTQYAPVSELTHRCEEEERRNLMPDNKDCLSSAEESDRMLEPDPRIVLRPMGRVDDA